MKLKRLILAAAAALTGISAAAVPAKPGTFRYTQPDGTVVVLQRHGDEFLHWTTTTDGQVVALDAKGFYRPSAISDEARAQALTRRQEANRLRRRGLRDYGNGDNPLTHGERHIPVFLVQFTDVKFSISDPVTKFDALLNQVGYSANGATGSVRDYYYDNSHGAFTPIFDVYPVVDLPHDMAYYGADPNAYQVPYAVVYAAQYLDQYNNVDFTQYDYDNDGWVDMCLMYYAGHNEAEGGSVNSIWPHQWWVNNITYAQVDGLYLGRYFCTSELKGSWGTNQCGIGTTCHEFGHSLGLPDFYDTYEADGDCGALYNFSTMCSGSYNNDSRTPPYFNAEERVLLDWLRDDQILTLPDGNVSFGSVKNDTAYRSYTETTGEYFLYECRDGQGWDSPLPTGLLVYHVDKSSERTVSGITPYELWFYWENYNRVNGYSNHPCFYIIPAYDPTSLNFYYGSSYIVFPGNGGITGYMPIDWNGKPTGATLSGIDYSAGKVSMYVTQREITRSVYGTVTGPSGMPLAGITVTVNGQEAEAFPLSRAPRVAGPRSGNSISAITDASGTFDIDLSAFSLGEEVKVQAAGEGYITQTKTVSLKANGNRVDFSLQKALEADGTVLLSYYDPDPDQWFIWGESPDGMATIRIGADATQAYAGMEVHQISFYLYCSQVSEVYVVADAGGRRLLTYRVPEEEIVPGDWSTVDLTGQHLAVPAGQDLYIGYAYKGVDEEYPALIAAGGGNAYFARFSTGNHTQWSRMDGYDLACNVRLGPAYVPPTLAEMGFHSIDPGKGSYKAGDSFTFKLRLSEKAACQPQNVSWTFDGEPVSADSVTLTAGTHVVRAILSYSGFIAEKEILEMELQAQ